MSHSRPNRKISLRHVVLTVAVTLFVVGLLSLTETVTGQNRPDPNYLLPEDDPSIDFPTPLTGSYSLEARGVPVASSVGFQYMNNFLVMQQVHEHLRTVPLVTWHGDAAGAAQPAASGYPSYSTGGYNTAPYGGGYAPGYEASPYYQSGYPTYDQNGQMMAPQGYAPQGYYPPGANLARQSGIYRGQAAYGDPGTLIYSLWGAVVGGSGKVKDHSFTPGYDTEQYGGVVGLDLFCASDCRSGLFFAYQQATMKQKYNYADITGIAGRLENWVPETPEIPPPLDYNGTQYLTDYGILGTFNGVYDGSIKFNNSLLGIYHQFGDEFVYNIATLRGGLNQATLNQTQLESGNNEITNDYTRTEYVEGQPGDPISDGTETYAMPTTSNTLPLTGKYDNYLAGVGFERGAHFKLQPFTFTPRAALDYTWLHRNAFTLQSNGIDALKLAKGDYHSVRSNIGGDIALDMYPGQQHLQFLLRGSWNHEWLDYLVGNTKVDSPAPQAPQSFDGNSMGRDWALLGIGANWTITPPFMIYANYDYMANKYLDQHYGSIGLGFMW